MAGKFEVYRDKRGKFRFRLKAGNGEIIAVGEAYESKQAAMGGIESIRSNAMAAALVDLTDAPNPAATRAAAKTPAAAGASATSSKSPATAGSMGGGGMSGSGSMSSMGSMGSAGSGKPSMQPPAQPSSPSQGMPR